jgi:CRP/FNR family transcriptional regulator, cyclic AMP receptor protein
MSNMREVPLHERARAPNAHELDGIPWLKVLSPHDRMHAISALKVGDAEAGEYLVRVGRPVTYWFGVIEGLLKMGNDDASGRSVTFVGVAPGGWFGEGTVLKREAYRYNIQALKRSVVAGLPIDTFHWLLDNSIAFNRFVLHQLNERVSQFIATVEMDRLPNTNAKVARSLASLAHPALAPNVGEVLRITQQELAYLCGLSRQRVNEALADLEQRGLIRVEYGGVRVPDWTHLRTVAQEMGHE